MRTFFAFIGAWAAAVSLGLAARVAAQAFARRFTRRACPHDRETVDARYAHMEWWCLDCGARRELGTAFCIGSNKRTRRSA
jgi:hypothetical protein